ncbi:uncharacterized protein LOC106063245 isoform X12 [Biomphalaria glabrata]|uniref:Uncharacterized protein LOC106063245 isoform X12 n=1 Tax=Biomphalaria glabrata TaxID=6526 RepID=A0A9W2YSX8_BIOGL|nr:uncharacterized protein LOC106063245 isoform X12 [Biomphalaria glabrata]
MFSSVLFCCTVLVLANEATQEKEAEQRYWDVIKKDVERDLNTEKAERNFWDIVKERTARNFWRLSPEERKRDLENETERNFWRLSPQERKRDLERETE